uniref:Uncharacterized protein n=1 Tax=Desulfacinum infernum TaxID=35837 RepID=A0A832A8M7_9BACT
MSATSRPMALCIMVLALCMLVSSMVPSSAEARRMLRPGLSQSELKAKGQMGHEKAQMRWENLSPEQQAHIRTVGKQRAQQANQTAEEFWNSLTPEEQQNLLAGKERVTTRAKTRWQNKPQ